jgi:3-hydroxyisobutyrate dehydrogenase-like beta-hydroxyacid dehydrogenase
MPELRVGFIGLGRMGAPMARCLLRAGMPLTVFNRDPAKALPMKGAGADVAETPAAAAADADVVITMVSDGTAAREVLTGRGGVLDGAAQGLVVVEMSTIGPDAARALATELAARDVTMLDAPVSGSVSAADSGELVVMVGGDGEAFARVRSVLGGMSIAQLWLGGSGAGAAMKLAINGMVAATAAMLGEALIIAERNGIASEAAYDAIAHSAVASPFVGYKRQAYLNPTTPVAFSIELMRKDLALALDNAQRLGVAAFAVTSDRIGPEADISAIASAVRAQMATGRAGAR